MTPQADKWRKPRPYRAPPGFNIREVERTLEYSLYEHAPPHIAPGRYPYLDRMPFDRHCITLVGTHSTPADNGSEAGAAATISITAQEGDLVVIDALYRGTDVRLDFAALADRVGGVWSAGNFSTLKTGVANVSPKRFWCQVPPGGLTGSPTITESLGGLLALTLVAHVFRPSRPGMFWIPCIWPRVATFTAGVSPFTKTITGQTSVTQFGSQSHVFLGAWFTADDNTWDSFSGTGWTESVQVRNLTGSDSSYKSGYKIQTASGASSNVSCNQATLGGDAGATIISAWTEIQLPWAGGIYADADGHIQSIAEHFGTSDTSIVKAFGGAVGVGNGVFVKFGFEDNGYPTFPITDNQGNEYIPILCFPADHFNWYNLWCYRGNIRNGPTTITLTLSETAGPRNAGLIESDRIGVLRQMAAFLHITADSGNPDTMSAGAITTTEDGAFIIGTGIAVSGSKSIGAFSNDWGTERQEYAAVDVLVTLLQSVKGSITADHDITTGDDGHIAVFSFIRQENPALLAIPPIPLSRTRH